MPPQQTELVEVVVGPPPEELAISKKASVDELINVTPEKEEDKVITIEEESPKYRHGLSFILAMLSSLGFAIGNYAAADLSIQFGFIWYFPTFIPGTIAWLIWNTLKHYRKNKAREAEGLK